MHASFQRKLSVEFVVSFLPNPQDNLDLVKVKTSKAKKTCRAMISFMNERIKIENMYAERLHNLARTGGV